MKCIYICGPLNAPACGYLENVARMMDQAEAVRKAGHAVLIPALDILMGIKFGNYSYEDYFNNNIAWLEKADAVYMCEGWEKSEGCKKEAARAVKLGIPVYTTMEELKNG
jgi:hypothetical protein